MPTELKSKQLKPHQGIIVFFMVILAMLFVAVPVQLAFGLYGLAITEVIILLFALIPAIILKVNLREMFPVKRPMIRQIFGVIFMWLGSYIAVTLVSLIIGYFFTKGLTEVSNEMQSIFTSVPMGVAFLIVAVMPAICEEALHRGLILYSFNSISNKWLRIFYMGIIFGIFHLDPFRFFQTAILGMAMTYIMIETNNMILPIFLHFINNALTTFISFTNQTNTSQLTDINSGMMLNAISVYLIIGSLIPFLLLAGARLLHKKERKTTDLIEKRKRKINIIIAIVCSVLMILLGAVTIALNPIEIPAFETSISMDVNHKSEKLQIPMNIDKSGEYMLDLMIKSGRGLINMDIIDENGKEIYQISCKDLTANGPIRLEEATYTINVDFLMNFKDVEEYYSQNDIEYTEDLKSILNLDGDLDEFSSFNMKLVIK